MILIVEDNPNARQLFARILSSAGYRTIECDDGGEALRLLDSQCFDLVLTDLALPNTTGFGVIAHIRKKSPRLPIILVTGYLAPAAARAILDDFVEFLPKPVDRDLLIAAVNRLLAPAPNPSHKARSDGTPPPRRGPI